MSLAVKHIDESGTEKLSLRALAREAGVSPTAPYSHFPTKTCLLAAIATEGFHELKDRIEEATQTEKDIFDRVIDMGLAYVAFAREHPTAYRLMFGSVLDDFSHYENLMTAADASYQPLLVALDELRRTRHLDVDPELLGAAIWSMVHGLSSLIIDKGGDVDSPAAFSPRRSIEILSQDPEKTLRFMLEGVINGTKSAD